MFPLFAAGVNDTGGKFIAGVIDTSRNLPPVSTTPAEPVANLNLQLVSVTPATLSTSALSLVNISANF